jgi:hypothetical protein
MRKARRKTSAWVTRERSGSEQGLNEVFEMLSLPTENAILQSLPTDFSP